jgi:hypothetical protein
MHTEEKAKELWCPHVRHADSHEETANCTGLQRVEGEMKHPWNTCVGSKCSQWRWTQRRFPYPKTHNTDIGFCGLAGKP